MDKALFNVHDLILIITAFECGLFSVLLVFGEQQRRTSNNLLAAFLLAYACISIHELTFWGAVFRTWVMEISPNLSLIASYAQYFNGPLLYLYIKSVVYSDFRLRRFDLIHLAPAAVYAVYLLFAFYVEDHATKVELIQNRTLAYSWHFVVIDAVCRTIRYGYCIACLALLRRYADQLKDRHSSINKIDLSWLKLSVISFLIVMIWEALLTYVKVYDQLRHINHDILEFMGLAGYYTTLAIINLLLFFKTRYFSTFEPVRQTGKNRLEKVKQDVNTEVVAAIEEKMRRDKPYLVADITLNKLAKALDIPAKELSATINGHFQMNFYEFVNCYRIEESKRLLLEPEYQHKSIIDIYMEVGFNSKSVFNTFFKKHAGMTPSQYRNKSSIGA